MADYPPPTQALPDFNPAVFRTNDIPLTIAEAENYFVSFPTAQGTTNNSTINVATLNVSGTLTTTSTGRNLGFGYEALLNRTAGSGTHNTAFGYNTLRALTLGGDNTAIGDNALPLLTGANAVAENNTAVGHQTGLYLAEGIDNTFIGFNAGAGTSSHTGCNYNTAVGSGSASALSTGDNNTCIGFDAGNILTTGSNNTFLGYNTDTDNSTSTFRTVIGSGAQGTANNTITLGRPATSATRTTYEVVRLNVIEPIYTTLTQVEGQIGYQYTPVITIVAGAGPTDIGTRSVGVGVWLVTFNITLATASATYLSLRDATAGGGTEYMRAYELTDTYSGSAVIPVLTGTKTITIRQTGASTGTGTGTQMWNVTRIA
jgi:hypothetical protein